MDPNTLLKNLMNQAADTLRRDDEADQNEMELAEGIVNLVEWLAKGGFAPDWKKGLTNAGL